MQIILAGYNVDAEVLPKDRVDATPETLSAAYARISRDPRPINELRAAARGEVEKARKSNSNIIFKMGHHSVAEHAVFNFDILGVSRLALEELEHFRLASYTEKSQRYIALGEDYVIPKEILDGKMLDEFRNTIKEQNGLYHQMIEGGVDKEDARYITSLATLGQVGVTMNARTLELLVRRFASHELAEVREIGKKMYEAAAKIAPSIILFTSENEYDMETYKGIKGTWRHMGAGEGDGSVVLIDHTKNADEKLVASLLHTTSNVSFAECQKQAIKMSLEEKREIIKKACQFMEFYDATLREFEHINLTFEIVISAAAFGQLKRHRLATLTCQKYDPSLGVTIPDSVSGQWSVVSGLIKKTEEAYEKISKENPTAAQYILTNAHRRRVLFTCNARELYHISRLREDKHAQWDIMQISTNMSKLAKEVMPLTMLLICGKDSYAEIFKKTFGKSPKILPPAE